MNQESLFHEDIYEALRTDIMALGGFKKVGLTIWPDKPMEQASVLLSACLNRARPEKLDPEQMQFIIREARKVGSKAAVTFMLSDASYAPPQPIEPEDEAADLRRRLLQGIEQFKRDVARLEKLEGP